MVRRRWVPWIEILANVIRVSDFVYKWPAWQRPYVIEFDATSETPPVHEGSCSHFLPSASRRSDGVIPTTNMVPFFTPRVLLYATDSMEKGITEEKDDDDQQDREWPALNPHASSSSSLTQHQQGGAEQLEEEERVERRRRMNMIHSRRKRQRRKIEVEVLKEQVDLLTSNNIRLRSENQQLEAMLAQVQQMLGTNPQQMLSQDTAAAVQPLVMGQSAVVAPPNMMPQQSLAGALQSNQLALQQILQYQLLSTLLAQQMGNQPTLVPQPLAAMAQAFSGVFQTLPTGQLPTTMATTGPVDSNGLLRLSTGPAQTVGPSPQPSLQAQLEPQEQKVDGLEASVQQEEPKRRDNQQEDNKSDRDNT